MKKALLFISGVASLMLFTGCGSSINLAQYSPTNAPKAEFMPTKAQLQGKKPNVIVMDADNNGIPLAQQAKAGTAIGTKINGSLAESKEVNIVNRLKRTNLEDEVKRAELAKTLGKSGVNYVVTGKISNATYNWTFHEEQTWTDKKGRVHVTPPSITYEACVDGNIKVYSLPNLKDVKTIPIEACVHDSEDARSPSDARKSNPSLVREAAMEAAGDATYPLKNFFAPKGYIEDIRRDSDGDLIAEVTIGTNDGLKTGQSVKIYTIKSITNKLSDTTQKETLEIGDGTVSDQLGPDYAWIIIKDLKNGETLHIGDYIKPVSKESILKKIWEVIN